jgi:beta-lactamase regulating signal transducer with metallopeptidase domain
MEKLFMELLKLSITGTLFVLAVLLLRLIFRKAPKWVFCMLWGLTALHLLIPVSVKTDVSVLPQSIASGQAVTDLADSYVGEVEYIYENTPNYIVAVEAGRKPVHSAEGFYVVTQKGSVEAPATVENTVLPVLSWIWLAGVAVMVGYTAVSYELLKRKVATATACAKGIR